jgi:hypothetical protein
MYEQVLEKQRNFRATTNNADWLNASLLISHEFEVLNRGAKFLEEEIFNDSFGADLSFETNDKTVKVYID